MALQLRSSEALGFRNLSCRGGFGLRSGYLDLGIGPLLFQLSIFFGGDPRGQMVDRKRRDGDDPHRHQADYVRPL